MNKPAGFFFSFWIFLLCVSPNLDAQVTWTCRNPKIGSLGVCGDLNDINWNGTRFITVGSSGIIITSTDGTTWTHQDSGTSNELRGVTWTGTQYVAVGAELTILTSPDGVTWTKRDSGLSTRAFNQFNRVAASPSIIVIGGEQSSEEFLLSSPDGITWTQHTITRAIFDVIWSGTQFVAVQFTGHIHTSPNGTDWTFAQALSATRVNGVAYNGTSTSVAVGSGGVVATSSDGTTWTDLGSPVGTSTTEWKAVGWTGSVFVAVGSGGEIFTSPNGTTWTERSSPESVELNQVIFGGPARAEQIYAVGDSGRIFTSPDRITWTARTSGTSKNLDDVTFAGSIYVAVGGTDVVDDPPEIIISSDGGVTWSQQTSGVTERLFAVGTNGSRLVAVGDGATILTSDNGTDWTSRTAPGSIGGTRLTGVASDGSGFAVTGF